MFNRNKIVRALEAKGWSKYRLCKEAHMAQSTLSTILSGEAKNPNIKTLQRIADALGVPVNTFFDDDVEFDAINLEDEDTSELKILFDKIRDLSEDDKKRINAIVEAFKKENQD